MQVSGNDQDRFSLSQRQNGFIKAGKVVATPNLLGVSKLPHIELSDAELAELIEKKLHSRDSHSRVKALGDVNFMSLTVEYLVLHRRDSGYEEFIDEIINSRLNPRDESFREKIRHSLIKSLRKRLDANEDTFSNNERVYDFIVENYIKKGYMFHGFNGAFDSSIQKHGLNSSKFMWDEYHLDTLETILNRVHGHKDHMALGWRRINYGTGNIFLSGNVDNSKSYALRSPEWFSEFCCGRHLGLGLDAGHPRRLAYMNKDYDSCKLNIEFFINSHSHGTNALSEAERVYIRDFFDGYWNEFCGKDCGPKLALIKRSALGLADSADNYFNTATYVQRSIGRSDLETLYAVLFEGNGLEDYRTNSVIPAEAIQLISI